MKIAVASHRLLRRKTTEPAVTVGQNKSSITSHTGKCRNFWIYEVNPKEILGKELLEISSEHTFYNSSPHDPHPLDNVQVMIAGGIGKGLMRRLERQGVEGVVTLESDPDLAVISYLENSLVREIIKSQGSERQHHRRHAHSCS